MRSLKHVFTSAAIVDMDEDTLRRVAGEPAHVVRDRERNNEKLATLEQVLQICSRHVSYAGKHRKRRTGLSLPAPVLIRSCSK